MASSYSSSLFLELMETGANASTWGTNTNENLKVIDSYLSGVATIGVSGGTVNVASANADPTSDAANKILEFTGTLSSNATVTLPNVEGNYLISTLNMTFDGFTVDVAPFGNTGASVSLNEDAYHWVYISGGVAKNGLSNLSSVTINGDLSNVTGNATITGNVDITGNVTVTGTTTFNANVDLQDNDRLLLGTGDDLQIYHDGSNSIIKDDGTGNLRLQSTDSIQIGDEAMNETFAIFNDDGAVSLYYDNSVKLATTSGGISVTGGITATGNIDVADDDKLLMGTSDDLQIYHDGSNSIILENGTGNLRLQSTNSIQIGDEAMNETFAIFNDDGAVSLYHNNSAKLSTTSGGVTVDGDLSADNIGNITARNLFTTTSTSTPSNSTGSNGDFYLIHES